MRQCGECNLCCKLLPVHDNEPWRSGPALNKPAGVPCPYQKHRKGCKVYDTNAMPYCCKVWNCRWIVNDDMADQSRPDRSHLVVDVMPDYITAQDNETGKQTDIQVVQVWCDPSHPDAHRDPAFRAYLRRLGEKNIAALIRYNSKDALTIIPPSMTGGFEFIEVKGGSVQREHSPQDKERALGTMEMVFAKKGK